MVLAVVAAACTASSAPGLDAGGPASSGPASSGPVGPGVGAAAGPGRADGAAEVVRGRVSDVVDGDTLVLEGGLRVRLAIVDTPEIHGTLEPCGPEAAALTASLVGDRVVAVLRPPGAPPLDVYGRTVGEVVRVDDGTSLNEALVAAGLATADERYTAEDPDLAARLARIPAATPACARPGPSSASEPVAAGAHAGRVDGGWTCHPAYLECLPQGSDLDCDEVGHRVALTGTADPYRLDGASPASQDGVGCESYGPWSPTATYPYYR